MSVEATEPALNSLEKNPCGVEQYKTSLTDMEESTDIKYIPLGRAGKNGANEL